MYAQSAPRVRVLSVRAHERPVLVVPVRGGSEPDGAVGLVDGAGRTQPLDRGVDLALLGQRALGHVRVEPDAEPGERGFDLREDAARPLVPQALEPFARRAIREPGPLLLEDVPRDLDDVLPVVPVLGHLRVAAEQLQVPGLDGGPEPVHLPARVVEVVLALDGPARGLEHAGERVPERGVACVADVERTRRVGADELDLHALPARLGPAVRGTAIGDLAECVHQPVGREAEVDEPRPRDLHGANERRGRQVPPDDLRDVARRPARATGEHEGHVGREVAVLPLLRARERDLRQLAGQIELGRGGRDGVGQERGEFVVDHRRSKPSRPLGAGTGRLRCASGRARGVARLDRSPRSSVDRASASGAGCAGSSPAEGTPSHPGHGRRPPPDAAATDPS